MFDADYLQAINITAIAGDKGSDPYTCQVTVCVCVCVCVYVCACMHACCVRACVCAACCVHACVRVCVCVVMWTFIRTRAYCLPAFLPYYIRRTQLMMAVMY